MKLSVVVRFVIPNFVAQKFKLAFFSCLLIFPATAFAAELKYKTFEGVPFSKHNDVDLLADIYMPCDDGPHAGVLLIHGGSWIAGNRRELRRVAHRLAPLGFTVMAIDYRLAPKDKFPAQSRIAGRRWSG